MVGNLVRAERFKQVADAFAQFRLADDVAVGQAALAERVKKRLLVFARQRKQLVKRHGVDARLRDVDCRLRLVSVHPFFNFERADVPDKSSLKVKGTRHPALITPARRTYGGIPNARPLHPVVKAG